MELATLMLTIPQVFWYFLPAGLANMAPVFAAHWHLLPWLHKAIDRGIFWRGQPLLGTHKTWRGLVVGIIIGGATAAVQHLLVPMFSDIATAASWGMLLGFAALFGDAIKSFFKRRMKIPSGKPWTPWDQIDFILGALIISQLFFPLSLLHNLTAIIIFGSLSYLLSKIGVMKKIKPSI